MVSTTRSIAMNGDVLTTLDYRDCWTPTGSRSILRMFANNDARSRSTTAILHWRGVDPHVVGMVIS